MSQEKNDFEVKHFKNFIVYGLIFALVFFGAGISISSLLKMNGVNEMTSGLLFNTMGFHNISKVLYVSGLGTFGMASIITWVFTAIGFIIGAVLGWNKTQ